MRPAFAASTAAPGKTPCSTASRKASSTLRKFSFAVGSEMNVTPGLNCDRRLAQRNGGRIAIQRYFGAKRQQHVLVSMPSRKPRHNGIGSIAKKLRDDIGHFPNTIALTLGKTSEDQSPYLVKLSGHLEVRKHSFNAVRLLANILKEKDLTFGIHLVRRPQGCHKQRKASSSNLPFRHPAPKDLWNLDLPTGFFAQKGSPKELPRPSGHPRSDFHGNHRTVEGHQPAFLPQPIQQNRHVTIAHKYFRMPPYEVYV